MSSSRLRFLIALVFIFNFLLLGCSHSDTSEPTPPPPIDNPNHPPQSSPLLSDSNVLSVGIGSVCGSNIGVNQPCVSVTICQPGTSTCTTISNILLDTGSFGLRVFKSLLVAGGVTLTNQTTGSSTVAECYSYADGSSDWGPVATADVKLSGLKASNVAVQLIDSSFAGKPTSCLNPDADPPTTPFNGVLGVGFFAADCGNYCVTSSSSNVYFACSGSSCNAITRAESLQVTNPVFLLPSDNNGVTLQLPSVASTGAATVSGYLILGVGTRANNTPVTSGGSFYLMRANGNGNFIASFNGKTFSNSFVDSGSNGLFFPGTTALPECTATATSGFFCPTTTQSLSASQTGTTGSPAFTWSFEIANADNLLAGGTKNVFSNLGGNFAGDFDWGLPFYLGRTVYQAFENASTSLGTGPFWAY